MQRHLDHMTFTVPIPLILCNPLLPQLLPPLCRPALGLVNPLVIGIPTLVQLCPDNTLEQLAHKAHKVVSSQRVLPQPPRTLILLLFQLVLVADFSGANTQIATARHEVEPDFRRRVACDAALQHGNDLLRKLRGSAGPVGDGRRLQAVEFVERVFYACVTGGVVH